MNIDMQSLIGEMSILIDKIKNGSATQGEIEAFAAGAADLHERAVVLRYKMYEAKVFGSPVKSTLTPDHTLEQPEETTVAEELVTTEAAVESHDPDISFALFEEPEEKAQPETAAATTADVSEGFDLFSMDDDDEDEQPDFDEADKPEVTAETQEDLPDFNEPERAAEDPQAEPEVHNPEPVIEQPVMEGEIKSESESFTPFAEPEAASAQEEERPLFAEPEVKISAPYDEILPQVAPASSEEMHPLYDRLKTNDDSLASKLMAVRLETLKGAFGFNERMQIVQELFQGNNDAFSEAIDSLDQLDSKNEARRKVSAYANRFDWDERSDLVMEFVQKVERRYA